MRELSKKRLLLYIGINVMNMFLFFGPLFTSNKPLRFFLTFWTYWANSLYYLTITVCDGYLYYCHNNSLEKINNFFRNIYSRYSFTFSYGVTILYWLLFFLGPYFLYVKPGFVPFLFHIYYHGGFTAILLLDLNLNDHKNFKWSYKEIIILSCIFFIYAFFAGYAKYVIGFIPYAFMENASIKQLATSAFIIYIIFLNSYQIHLYLLKLKNTNKENGSTVRDVSNTISEEKKQNIEFAEIGA